MINILLYRRLPGFNGNSFVKDPLHRKVIIWTAINTDDSHSTSPANGLETVFHYLGRSLLKVHHCFHFLKETPVSFHPHSIDANVGAPALCQIIDRLHGIYFGRIDRLHTVHIPRHVKTVRQRIDSDHSTRAL
jgi:hypothetical protein